MIYMAYKLSKTAIIDHLINLNGFEMYILCAKSSIPITLSTWFYEPCQECSNYLSLDR